MSGTSASIRNVFVLLTTVWPADAKAGSRVAGHAGVEGREHQLRRTPGDGRFHHEVLDVRRRRPAQQPRQVAVPPAGRPFAGAEPGHPEPRMIRQTLDQLLPDDAGGSENADVPTPCAHGRVLPEPSRSSRSWRRRPCAIARAARCSQKKTVTKRKRRLAVQSAGFVVSTVEGVLTSRTRRSRRCAWVAWPSFEPSPAGRNVASPFEEDSTKA